MSSYLKIHQAVQDEILRCKMNGWDEKAPIESSRDVDGDGQTDLLRIEARADYYFVFAELSSRLAQAIPGDPRHSALVYFGVGALSSSSAAPSDATYDAEAHVLTVRGFPFHVEGQTDAIEVIEEMGRTMTQFDPWLLRLASQGVPHHLVPLTIVVGEIDDIQEFLTPFATYDKKAEAQLHLFDYRTDGINESTQDVTGWSNYSVGYHVLFVRDRGRLYRWANDDARATSRHTAHEFSHVVDRIIYYVSQLGTNRQGAFRHRWLTSNFGLQQTDCRDSLASSRMISVAFDGMCQGFYSFIDNLHDGRVFPSKYVQDKFKQLDADGRGRAYAVMEYAAEMGALRFQSPLDNKLTRHPEDIGFFHLQDLLALSHGDPYILASLCENADAILNEPDAQFVPYLTEGRAREIRIDELDDKGLVECLADPFCGSLF